MDTSLFPRLKRLFSTETVVRNVGGKQLRVMDVERIQSFGMLQTNSLVDRFTRLHKAGQRMQFNPTLNYQTLRLQLYADYEAMDTDGIIASVLDIICEESTLKGEIEEVLTIRSSNENIQRILYNLFYDVLNIEFNLPMWIRSMCLHKDTKIPLLDGTEKSIKDLAAEFENNPDKEIWVYSVQEGTNQVVPGKVKWCGLTKENTAIMRTTLDDGTYLDTTPDHKFIMRDGSKVEAKDLKEGQSLMPFYTTSDDKDDMKGITRTVVSVVSQDELSDTYCMEVEGPSGEQDRHNFAVCSNNVDGTHSRNGVFVSNCKYGDFYLKLDIAEKFGIYAAKPLSVYDMIREEGQDPNNPAYIRFIHDPVSVAGGTTATKNKESFENFEIAHFRLLTDTNYLPYGRSYIEPARKYFKQYTLMLDAMLLHRIMRAPEKRIFYINVGNIPPNEVDAFIQKTVTTMKKTPFMDQTTGDYNLKFNVQNMLEDFYIPVRPGDNTTKIDTAKGLEYAGIEDVEFLRDLMLGSLKVPKAFLNYSDELNGKSTISSLDVRFSRTIERIQRIVLSELEKIALIHLYVQGFEDADLVNFKLGLNNPSIIYEQEKIALLKEKVALSADIIDKKLFSSDWVGDKIFQMSEDQINEQRELISEDVKRTFRYSQIENEGNDPTISGESYGTPHDLATVYNRNNRGDQDVPDGYNEFEKNPVGRPKEKASIYGTDKSAFGRDPLGKKGMKEPKPEVPSIKNKARAFALESMKGIESLKKKKMIIYEEKINTTTLLDEKNIIDDEI